MVQHGNYTPRKWEQISNFIEWILRRERGGRASFHSTRQDVPVIPLYREGIIDLAISALLVLKQQV